MVPAVVAERIRVITAAAERARVATDRRIEETYASESSVLLRDVTDGLVEVLRIDGAYAQGVADVLRWLAGDASEQESAVLRAKVLDRLED